MTTKPDSLFSFGPLSLGLITICYFLLTSPGEHFAFLLPYVSTIISGYDQGRRARQQNTPKEYRNTLFLLGLLTIIAALFYHLTAKSPSPFILIYYLLLPFISTWMGFSSKT